MLIVLWMEIIITIRSNQEKTDEIMNINFYYEFLEEVELKIIHCFEIFISANFYRSQWLWME